MVTATKEYRKVDLDTTTKHYDPETGAWDGQLAAPGMPAADEPTERKDWPKVFPRMAWADAVVDAQRYRGAQAAVFHRMTIRAGTPKGCTESVGNIAKGLGIDRRSVQRAIKAIKADGYMAVEERTGGTYICVPNLDRGAAQCHGGGGTVSPQWGGTVSPKRNSSSNPERKGRGYGVDTLSTVKRAPAEAPETGARKPIFSGEGRKGHDGADGPGTGQPSRPAEANDIAPALDLAAARAWIAENLPNEYPTDSQIAAFGTHLWPAWSKHWARGWDVAFKHWCKDATNRKQFKADAAMHLVQVGLPQPKQPNAEDAEARERMKVEGDKRIAESEERDRERVCAHCGRKRLLQAGQTMCHQCRKDTESTSTPTPIVPARPAMTEEQTHWHEAVKELGGLKGNDYAIGALLRDVPLSGGFDLDGGTLRLVFRHESNLARFNAEYDGMAGAILETIAKHLPGVTSLETRLLEGE